jgi:quinol monooxygenase YgiN
MTDVVDPRRALYAEFTAKPGNVREVVALVRQYAELVRSEPGNLVFATHQKRDDTDTFFVYEEYADSAAFALHVAAPYGADFNSALGELIVGAGSDLTFLVPV